MLLYFPSEVGRRARSRRGYGGWAVNLRVNSVGKIYKTLGEIIAHHIMLTLYNLLERVPVRLGIKLHNKKDPTKYNRRGTK